MILSWWFVQKSLLDFFAWKNKKNVGGILLKDFQVGNY